MTSIRQTVLNEIRNKRRTVTELCQYRGLTSRQVHGAIRALDMKYHIDRVSINGDTTYKVNRRRVVPMKEGIKRHIV
jgi:hypothetical protein